MARLSRSGETSPLGKLTEPIGPVKISVDTKEALDREARRAGLTTNEFVRELIMVRVHGKEEMRRLYEERIAVVAGKGEES